MTENATNRSFYKMTDDEKKTCRKDDKVNYTIFILRCPDEYVERFKEQFRINGWRTNQGN